jgi:hypothetical protein
MSVLSRVDRRRTQGHPLPEGPIVEPFDGAGVYLTDEVFLFRVVGYVASELGDVVELEDCYWLDVVRVPVDVLRRRGLRFVAPAPPESSCSK